MRFAPTDATAPAVPQGLTATSGAGTVQLSWQGVSDAGYEVLREDRVVASITGTSLELPASADAARYFVRAVDTAGNRSATSPVVVPETVDPGTLPVTAIAAGGDWTYRYESDAPAGDWASTDFDDSGWTTGTAPLGVGSQRSGHGADGCGYEAADRLLPPLLHRRRRHTGGSAELTTRADDGVVVYVNGTEVARSNMPTGSIGHGTYATAAPTAAVCARQPRDRHGAGKRAGHR